MSETNTNPGGGAKRAWPLFIGLPLIVAIALAAVLLSGGRSGTAGHEEPPAEKPASGGEAASRGGAELGHPTLGRADAPVVMIEYGDFR